MMSSHPLVIPSERDDHGGITTAPITPSKAVYTAIVILTALGWYNVLELNFLVLTTFKRYRGLYFWSLIICSWGTALQALGFILKFFPTGTNTYLSVAIITIGWYCMVSGESVVLYSRLHLVVRDRRVFRLVLTMIIVDAILFHIPTTVLTFGSNTPPATAVHFTSAYQIMEKVQMTAFTLQELVISGIYVQATMKLYRRLSQNESARPIQELFLINVIIIAMDIALLGVEYANIYEIEVILKSFVYSIKLKIEFAVLTELKSFIMPINREQNHASASGRKASAAWQSNPYHQGSGAMASQVRSPPSVHHDGILKTVETNVTLSHAKRHGTPEEDVMPINDDPASGNDRFNSFISLTSSDIELEHYSPQASKQRV